MHGYDTLWEVAKVVSLTAEETKGSRSLVMETNQLRPREIPTIRLDSFQMKGRLREHPTRSHSASPTAVICRPLESSPPPHVPSL